MSSSIIPNSNRVSGFSSEQTKPLQICMIGAGKMIDHHLNSVVSLPEIAVAGIASRSGTSGEQLAQKYPIRQTFTDWREMLDVACPDAVFVAVSHNVAFDVYSEVIGCGIPCLLEKPAGYNSAQCLRLLETAEEHRTRVMIGVNRRFYSNIQQALLEILHRGPIRGILVETHEHISNFRNRLQFEKWVYDEWMIANSIHAIDMFRMFVGEPAHIHQLTMKNTNGDNKSVTAVLEFENGSIGTFVSHFNSGGGFGITVYGDGVTAVLKPMEQGFLYYANGRIVALEVSRDDLTYKPGLYLQNKAFLSSVINETAFPYPASDLADHLKSIRLIEKLQSAA